MQQGRAGKRGETLQTRLFAAETEEQAEDEQCADGGRATARGEVRTSQAQTRKARRLREAPGLAVLWRQQPPPVAHGSLTRRRRGP